MKPVGLCVHGDVLCSSHGFIPRVPGPAARAFGLDPDVETDPEAEIDVDPAEEEVRMPATHAANFVLPAALDDFGGQAVERMQTGNAFLALLEYGDAEVGTALFSGSLPRRLSLGDFSDRQLQRQLPDQLGTQVFATEGGRAFCLYVVLAGRQRAGHALDDVNEVLSSLQLEPR